MNTEDSTPEAVGSQVVRSVRPCAWRCRFSQDDGTRTEQYVTTDPAGLNFNDIGEPNPYSTAPVYDQAALDAAVAAERERMCAAIKAEDDYCCDEGDYMLDSDDCISVIRGTWVRPDYNPRA